MSDRVVAIHQPNFLPWLGYFDKLARADVFVLLDHVQFPKTGGTWTNRVRMLIAGEPRWVTVPIVRAEHGVRAVSDVRINESRPWREQLLRTIRESYAQAPFFEEIFAEVTTIVSDATDRLAAMNERGILRLAEVMRLDGAQVVRSSDLNVSGAATPMLVSIVQQLGGSVYLAGGGAAGYQQDDLFREAGIEVAPQGFSPSPYPDELPRPAGLSAIDALMTIGPAATRGLIGHRIPTTGSP